METKYIPKIESERQRIEWFNAHLKPGMNTNEVLALNDQARRLFPVSDEERRDRAEYLKRIPEFVL
jgi:hypothetical protein